MTATDVELKNIILNNPGRLEGLRLTERRRLIIRTVASFDYPTMSSRELSEKLEISLQSASQELARLALVGYLAREERTSSSGGIVYRYKLAPGIGCAQFFD